MAQAKDKAARSLHKAPLAHGVGRRKKAIARIWLRRGKGNIQVNKQDVATYFDTPIDIKTVQTPVYITSAGAHYDVQVNVRGGGKTAQANAIKLAIARGLVVLDESSRSLLRKEGLLTVDDRVKERKKYGQKAARRKFQFVKR